MYIDKLKIFTGSIVLATSITLMSGCSNESADNYRKLITEGDIETIICECAQKYGCSYEEVRDICNLNIDMLNDAGFTLDEVRSLYSRAIENYEKNKEKGKQKANPHQGEVFEEIEGTDRTFEAGEHILVRTLESAYDVFQIPYNGYSVIGTLDDKIIYVNDIMVVAKATGYNEETGEYFYQNFGTSYKMENDDSLIR